MGVPLLGMPTPVAEIPLPTPPVQSVMRYALAQVETALCSPAFKRCTINAIPQTAALLQKSRVPFGLIVHPFKALEEGEVCCIAV